MATTLENYRQQKQQLQQLLEQSGIKAAGLWRYGELVYRIGVLETCQAYCKSAPVTTNTTPLTRHYQMLDACIQSMAHERGYGPIREQSTEEELKKERNAARTNFDRVVQDYRKRFSSFAPASDTAYSQEVNRVIQTVIPVWLQMRETFVPLREKQKEDAHQ